MQPNGHKIVKRKICYGVEILNDKDNELQK